MSAEANRDLYRRWLFEVWGAGDYEVADQVIAADLVVTPRTRASRPGAPATSGPRHDGQLAEVWHVEELPRMLEALHLGPPPSAVLKMTARLSAWQYRREQRKHAR